MGISGYSESAFNDINTAVGEVIARRTYNTTLPASWAASTAASDVAAGRISYWSWKPNVSTFPTDTNAKNAFGAFLDSIPVGHQAVIMAWHEPENEIANGDFTLEQWGAVQDTMMLIVKGKNRLELRTAICLMGPWTFDTRSGRTGWDWEGCLNWGLVDIVGIDPYRTTAGATGHMGTILTVNNSGSGSGGAQPSTMDILSSWGKPVVLMEWAASYSTPGSTVVFIEQSYAWFKNWNRTHPQLPIESAIWFNYSFSGAENELVGIEVDAYAAAVADSKVS